MWFKEVKGNRIFALSFFRAITNVTTFGGIKKGGNWAFSLSGDSEPLIAQKSTLYFTWKDAIQMVVLRIEKSRDYTVMLNIICVISPYPWKLKDWCPWYCRSQRNGAIPTVGFHPSARRVRTASPLFWRSLSGQATLYTTDFGTARVNLGCGVCDLRDPLRLSRISPH